MDILSRLYNSGLFTNENRTSYLRLKKYTDDDYRLVYGTCKKVGFENISFFPSHHSSQSEIERSSLSRAYREILEICRCNPFRYFVTLTINSKTCDRFSLEQCQLTLRKNLKEYKRRCSRNGIDFKYIIVTEKHVKGSYHFHGLFTDFLTDDIYLNNNGYYSSRFFNDRMGFFSFSKIKNRKRCSFYISKYIFECPIKSETNQLYFCSKGLARAEVFDLPQSAGDLQILQNFWGFSNDYVKIRDFDFSKIDSNFQLFFMNKKE